MQLALGALGGAGVAASGGSIATAILGGIASVGGALAAIGAGQAQAEGYRAQAFTTTMEAQNEKAQSVQRTGAMKRELARILGENDVNYAAAGIDISGGVAEDARQSAETRAAQEISIDRGISDSKRLMLRANAASYRKLARNAEKTGMLNAFTSLIGG